jgi:hypothetical protein
VPEVIDEGVSGFVVRNVDEAVAAVARLDTLDRSLVRATFERRFTIERMARDYLAIYRGLPGVRAEAMRLRVVEGGLAPSWSNDNRPILVPPHATPAARPAAASCGLADARPGDDDDQAPLVAATAPPAPWPRVLPGL